MELKNVITSKIPTSILDSMPEDFKDFVCMAIEAALANVGITSADKDEIASRVRKVADEMIAEAKDSETIPASWVVGWGYNLKDAVAGTSLVSPADQRIKAAIDELMRCDPIDIEHLTNQIQNAVTILKGESK